MNYAARWTDELCKEKTYNDTWSKHYKCSMQKIEGLMDTNKEIATISLTMNRLIYTIWTRNTKKGIQKHPNKVERNLWGRRTRLSAHTIDKVTYTLDDRGTAATHQTSITKTTGNTWNGSTHIMKRQLMENFVFRKRKDSWRLKIYSCIQHASNAFTFVPPTKNLSNSTRR